MSTIAINTAILKQLRQQQRTIQRRQTLNPFIVGTYSDRASHTPTRRFTTASGGVYYTQKIALSVPQKTPPVITRGVMGRVGVYDQR